MIDRLDGELPEDMLANARLLVSELVANAVEHVQEDGEIEVRVARDGVLRVEVLDPGPGFTPAARRRRRTTTRGWGLHFIDRLAALGGGHRRPRARVVRAARLSAS